MAGRLLVVAALAIAGCRDVAAPERPFAVVVARDTVRVNASSSLVRVSYSYRNTSNLLLGTTRYPIVEAENSVGAWTGVSDARDTRYIMDTPDFTIQDHGSWRSDEDFRLDPGRYRIHAYYWRMDGLDGTSSGAPLEAFSNVFVVLR